MSTSNEASKKEDTKREVAMEKAGKTLFSAIQKGLPTGKIKTVLSVFIVLLIVFTGYTSLYTVPSDSVAVVLRFGKFEVIKPSGLHFKVPLGIDQVNIVPTKRQLKQEFGFSTPGATDPDQNITPNRVYMSDKSKVDLLSNQIGETQMVTGDLNTALVEWVVQYRIANPKYYLFEVRDPAGTLRYVSESVMREVVGDRTVDEVITIGRQEIEVEALSKMQALSTKYVMGIRIDQVQLKNINPPQAEQASFNKVNQAQQEKEKLINEARREYNRVIPLAEGERDQRIREADGYRLKRINEAEGNALRFNALFAEYIKAPEVTRRRLYLETMQKVMPQISNKIIIDSKAQSVLPLLNLTTIKEATQ